MMKKLKNNKGYTFVEMMACVVILLLVALISGTGMNLALNNYNQQIFESDSQMLEATLNMHLGDILRHTTSVTEADGAVTGITNSSYQIYNGTITVEDGVFYIVKNAEDPAVHMVNEATYMNNLYVDNFTLTYDASTGVFSGTYTIKSNTVQNASKECTFSYRRIYWNN